LLTLPVKKRLRPPSGLRAFSVISEAFFLATESEKSWTSLVGMADSKPSLLVRSSGHFALFQAGTKWVDKELKLPIRRTELEASNSFQTIVANIPDTFKARFHIGERIDPSSQTFEILFHF